MDINRFNFWQTLPVVLQAISLSEYVAIDLEMTGMSGHSINEALEHTDEAAYHLAAEAARTFQIVQLGLTCLSYDREMNAYRAQTFTFYVTPEFTPPCAALAELIDRKVAFSYRSFLFLKENNFSFEKAFSEGVPYLSRSDDALATRLYLSSGRHQSTAYPGRALDTWSRKFYSDTRNEISAWFETNPAPGDSLLVTNPEGPSKQLLPVHVSVIRQIVRNEFPSCFVVLRRSNALAQVIKWDPEERVLWDGEYRRRHEAVVRQTGNARESNTGFRYVIEALVGGSFAPSIPAEFLLSDNHIDQDSSSIAARIARIAREARLRSDLRLYESRINTRARPVLIGHNPLLDLCFLVQTFLSPLPAEITAFRRDLHTYFPRIVDTKYLSSQLGFRSGKNLKELYRLVGCQGGPLPIVPEPGFDARNIGGAAHNAGFNSWMTAVVFVSLARKVELRNPRLLHNLNDSRGHAEEREQEGSASGSASVSSSSSGRRKDELFRELSPFVSDGGGEKAGPRLSAVGVIPQWDSEIWRRYGNKLWLGNAGVMDLAQA
ncbi:ribonuclease H-like domain-containing protein [Achaetomium macrosporum]|uniref:Ribonuclease H-like domain-containing protein n=1 Tax=Achaetomium macrosporum TaxID=79813 RepID=A0AAN7HF43_9PEZI|nr:ribonuclease H-like domain-containing protein [Achaetomium macrosporum]